MFHTLLLFLMQVISGPNLQWLVAWGTDAVVICSVLHAVLPPWEIFVDFPTAQKYYKLFIYFIGYIALNWRSTVWQSLSTTNGSKISKAAINGNGKQELDVTTKAGVITDVSMNPTHPPVS